MIRMYMGLVGNRSYTVNTGNNKRSRLRRLKDPKGIRLGTLSFHHQHL